MGVFVALTGGRGTYPCEVVCRHVESDAVAFSARGQVALRDPRQVVDLVFRLNGVRFRQPDMHWLHFSIDGVPIMMRPMFVQVRAADRPGEAPAAPES